MKRFFVTVTGYDDGPMGYSNMMMDCETMDEAKRVAVKTVSEQTGFPSDRLKATAIEKV